MRPRVQRLRVLVLIAFAAAIALGFLVVLGDLSLRSTYDIQLDFDYVGALRSGAPVKVSGIKVGRISDVEFLGGRIDDRIGKRVQVRVTARIDDSARDSIRADAEFFVNTAGMLGEQYLEIVPGTAWDRPPLAAGAIIHDDPARAPRRVHDPPRTDLVVARLHEVLEGVSEVLRTERGSIQRLLANGADAIGELDDLLKANRAPIGALLRDGAGLAKQATVTLADASVTLRGADRAIAALTPLASALLLDATRLTGLVTDDRVDRALVLADHASSAAQHAGALMTNVDGLVTELRSGKGTVGALLARDDLYRDLRELLRELRRNPWKLVWKE